MTVDDVRILRDIGMLFLLGHLHHSLHPRTILQHTNCTLPPQPLLRTVFLTDDSIHKDEMPVNAAELI